MEEFIKLLLFPAGLLAGLILKKYLPSYFAEKGKNLATKEDIEEITQKIESVRATILNRLHVSQFRYQKEFDILAELSSKTVDLRDATTGLRPSLDYPTDDEAARKRERYLKWQEAGAEFYNTCERNRPFYPQEIFEEVKTLEKLCHMESARFRIYSDDPSDRHYDPEYWENASRNADTIKAQTEKILDEIRERTKKWEEL